MAPASSITSVVSNQLAGFDTVAAVTGILTPQQFEIDQLAKRQADLVAKQDLLNQFNVDLQSLRTTSTAMADSTNFFAYGATLSSSNASVPASNLLAISGTNSVSAGSHALVVDQVATAERTSSSAAVKNAGGTAIAADSDILGLTTSSFQINGVTVDVTVNDSLLDIKNSINKLNIGSAATGVTASIVKVNTNDFRLVLAADSTGQQGFAVTGAALNSGGGALANLQLGAQASSAAVQDSATAAATTSDTAALGLSGTFQIAAGSTGTPTNVAILTTDSLQDIATKISAIAGLSATVDTVGTSDFRLNIGIDSANPPVDNTIIISDPNTVLGVGQTAAGLNLTASTVSNATSVVQAPVDAKLTVDGLQITRSSNTISDALSGVTIDLLQADSTTTVNMNISVDTAALQANVQSFIDGYNTVMGFINTQYTFDAATGSTGILASDTLLGSIQSSLSSSLLATVPGLASDRNSLALIGVEPDAKGVLSINPDRFDNFLNTDPTAIRDVFVATGTTDSNQLQFLTNGFNTPSGTYTVDITQAATRSIATGTAAPTISTDTLTITEGSKKAIINLTTSTNITTILDSLNSEFAKTTTEQRQLNVALSGGTANTSTTLSSLGFAVNDTITIAGQNRTGGTVNDSVFTILSTTDTLGDLLSAIQVAFDQQVVASIDSGGHIALADATAGDSLLNLTLTSSSVSLGTDTEVTAGRYAMNLQAIEDPTTAGAISIRAKSYGSSTTFSVTSLNNKLGIAGYASSGVAVDATAGLNVIGTINGNSATGSGQLLSGTSGNIDGMGLLFTGTAATVPPLTLTLGVGVGASYDGLLDTFSNNFTGLVVSDVQSMQTNYDSIASQITNLQAQMDAKRAQLTQSFTQMQQLLATLQSTGDFFAAQTNAQRAASA